LAAGGALTLKYDKSQFVKTATVRARLIAACVGLLILILMVSTSKAWGALYIGTESISRVNLDGSLFDPTFIAPQDGVPCAITVDSSHIYWADSYNHKIGRARLDGSNVENDFISLAAGTSPCGLAVDSEYLYWANFGTATIGRARLDGSAVDETFISTVPYPCAVAVNEAGIYWGSETEDEIWRTDIGGLMNGPELVIDEGAVDPCGLALVGPHLFWVQSGPEGRIGRANLDGSESQPAFIVGGNFPVSLVAHGGHLYWVNAPGDYLRSVGRADLDGANVNEKFIPEVRYAFALAADSVQLYPGPPAPPQLSRAPELGKIRRQQNGSVLFPIDLPGDGWLEVEARGAKVRVRPEGVDGRVMLAAGRKWLKISPSTRQGDGRRCVLRAFKRGARVRLRLRIRFTEPDKTQLAQSRRFLMFKPHRRLGAGSREADPPVSCPP
jgi:hypothetical protein